MLRRLAVVFAVGLTLLALASVPAVPVAEAETAGTAPPLTTPEGFNDTTFRVRAFANGSARWTVEHSRPLNTDEEVDQFRAYAQRFTTEDTQTFTDFRYRARQLVAFGTNATGREMNASGFARDAQVREIVQTQGVVSMSFLWSNFSQVRDGTVTVGDLFQGGLYITADQRFVIARGPTLAFTDVAPPPDSQSVAGNLTGSETVTWFGEQQFADERPSATLVPRSTLGGADGSTSTGSPALSPTADGTATPAAPAEGDSGMVMVVLSLVLLAGLGGGIAWYSGRLRSSGGAATAESASAESETVSPAAPEPEPEAGVPEEELLSDEDRVVNLLEENGGRMKQVKIVESTDWSKSKVSMLLSEMEEEGTISKLRVGRENIISKAGEEHDAVGSPFDDE